jgi:diguanylate cyclase (GGDEF)-like protein
MAVSRGNGSENGQERETCQFRPDGNDHTERYRMLLDFLPEGVLLIDRNGAVEFSNRSARDILGPSLPTGLRFPAEDLPLSTGTAEPPRASDNPLLGTRLTGQDLSRCSVILHGGDGSRTSLIMSTRALPGDGPPHPVLASFDEQIETPENLNHLRHVAVARDPLTGLPNRNLALQDLNDALRRPRQIGEFLAVLMIDLDNFTLINDSQGRSAGDEVLKTVARRLRDTARYSDIVARAGGDSFVVIVELVDPGSARRIAERIRDNLAVGTGDNTSMGELPIRASIGIVTVAGGDTRTATEVLRDADSAMYQAKAQGRNRSAVFDSQLREVVLRELSLETDLRAALQNEELRVAYQPIVDLQFGGWAGMEALARWNHPVQGSISPGEFIPLAERSDLIHALGAQVLGTACRDAAGFHAAGAPGLSVSVNLSVHQLEDPDLYTLVADCLRSAGLPARSLCLEVTESTLGEDEYIAVEVLERLRSLGVRISIDDFGTGYSSLGRLRTLPVDELKVDRSFITELTTNREGRSIVEGIVALGHTLGMRIVAEGVETREQSELLAAMGCDYAQGYYFGRPTATGEVDVRSETVPGGRTSVPVQRLGS